MIYEREKFFGKSRFLKYFLKLICLNILFIFYVLALCNVSQSKSLTDITLSHRLFFDDGITIAGNTVKGKIDGKHVVFRLSDNLEIFVESDCDGSCDGDTNYKKVSLESLRKRNEKKIYIDDPVIIVLNRLGFIKRIVIIRIPE